MQKLKDSILKFWNNIIKDEADRFLKKNEGTYKLSLISLFMSPFIILAALEIMHLSDIKAATEFFLPGQFWLVKLLFSYLFIFAFICIFKVIFRKITIAYLISGVLFWLLSFATYVTLELTGDPLLPSDLLLIKNVGQIASFVKIPFKLTYFISLAVIILGFIMLLHIQKANPKKLKFAARTAVEAVFVVFFISTIYLYCFNYDFRHRTMDKLNIEIGAFNPVDNLRKNGLVLTFFPRIGDLVVEKPENYSEEYISSLKNKYSDLSENNTKSNVKPTVILIQNEAWWDPSELPNVNFSSNPIPFTTELKEEGYPVGKLVSPVFSGGTCMPEFEALTGFSTSFLPASSYPYIQHILSETPSIVSAYRDNGYETVAIHPYHKNFYNRQKAYPLLGFDKFLGMDEMPDLERKGWYASDEYAVKQIIKAYQNKEKDNMFCFLVTMQNHGGYNPKRYDSYDIEVTSDSLNPEDLQGLRDYTKGVYDADNAFKILVEYFKTVNEPVIIAMYGDHQPLLGTDGSTYSDGGMIEKKDTFIYTDFPQLYKTPYVVWSNYGADIKLPEYISANKLGLSLMDKANLESMPWYFSVFDKFYSLYPAYIKNNIYDNGGNRINDIDSDDKELEKDYRMIQYDLLHGEKYSVKTE